MECGVLDLSLPKVTFIVHRIYLYFMNSKRLQNGNNDALSF